LSSLFDDSFRRRLEVLKRIVARALVGRGGGGRARISERGGRIEFADHRSYAAGDDLKTIDWAVYARLEKLVVKEFEAPREAQLLLIVDRSRSMTKFGKDEAALRLAAALGWLGLAAGARVAITSSGGASRWVGAPERFPELLDALERLPVTDTADFPRAVERAPAAATGRKTAVFVGDLYEAEPLARALAGAGRAQRVCVQVIAPEELHAPTAPALRVRDAETGEEREVFLDAAARARFLSEAEHFLTDRERLVRRHGARFARVSPGDDLVAAVEDVLLGRAAS
jgi:uncharacterized protein (DUF58 family)